MHDLLYHAYGLRIQDEASYFGRKSYTDGDCLYFIICVKKKEILYIEQCMLAQYLREQGLNQVALPIRNKNDSLFTKISKMHYIVFKLPYMNEIQPSIVHQNLASFHQKSQTFPYEPRYLNYYGFWSTLWMDQLTTIERQIQKQKECTNSIVWQRITNILPYMISLSEYAIQLMAEAEKENKFDMTDRPAICFERYQDQLQTPIILPSDLVYDHPIRDVGEWIRYKLLQNPTIEGVEISEWIQHYQTMQPLSILGIRMLYARLLYPLHFWDFCSWMISLPECDLCVEVVERFIARHDSYLRRVTEFFRNKLK